MYLFISIFIFDSILQHFTTFFASHQKDAEGCVPRIGGYVSETLKHGEIR